MSKKVREKLVSKLHSLLGEVGMIRGKIEAIDFAEEEEKRKKVIGKYFVLKSSSDKRDNSGYFFCQGYKDRRPIGIVIQVYGKGVNQSIHIELNWYTFDDWIENGHRIKPSEFKRYLYRAIGQMQQHISKKPNRITER